MLKALWSHMRKDDPSLLSEFESFLSEIFGEFKRTNRETEFLAQKLTTKQTFFENHLTKLQEEMEYQIRHERELQYAIVYLINNLGIYLFCRRATAHITEGIAIEREGLQKQLELLRSINRRLLDERDEIDSANNSMKSQTDAEIAIANVPTP